MFIGWINDVLTQFINTYPVFSNELIKLFGIAVGIFCAKTGLFRAPSQRTKLNFSSLLSLTIISTVLYSILTSLPPIIAIIKFIPEFYRPLSFGLIAETLVIRVFSKSTQIQIMRVLGQIILKYLNCSIDEIKKAGDKDDKHD